MTDKNNNSYVHRFASEQIRDESRGFWTKVAALLTVNSLLIAGYTLLYTSTDVTTHSSANLLLLAIAGSGIAIQFMWPLFLITSMCHFEYWGGCINTVENDSDYKLEKVWQNLNERRDTFYGTWLKPFAYCLRPLLWGTFIKNPAGAIAIPLFIGIFLAIWISAAFIVKEDLLYRLLTIFLPLLFLPIATILCALIINKSYECIKNCK